MCLFALLKAENECAKKLKLQKMLKKIEDDEKQKKEFENIGNK